MPDRRPAGRGQRPGRRLDPRLVLGIVLVLVSVAGVVGVVRATDATVAVYAAAAPLAPGQHVGADELVRRDVVLDGADERYLRVGSLPREGLVMIRAVGRGELLPSSAVGTASRAGVTALVVAVDGQPASAVRAGASVDLWAATPVDPSGTASDAAAPPAVLVDGATLVSVTERGSLVADDGRSVELLIPESRVARVLQAEADGARLTVVPSGLPFGSTP